MSESTRWGDADDDEDGMGGRGEWAVQGPAGWPRMAAILKQGATLPAMHPTSPADPLPDPSVNFVHPKKLLHGKWTAVKPEGKDKHFIVTRVLLPDDQAAPVEWIEIEAVMSRALRRIAWRELKDGARWRQGWV
jgi:tryptophan-rich hypothetical protein